jgi:hypothetical protein
MFVISDCRTNFGISNGIVPEPRRCRSASSSVATSAGGADLGVGVKESAQGPAVSASVAWARRPTQVAVSRRVRVGAKSRFQVRAISDSSE